MGKRPFYVIMLSCDYDGDTSSDVSALCRTRKDAIDMFNFLYTEMYEEAANEYGGRIEADGNIERNISIQDMKDRPLTGNFHVNDEYRNEYIYARLFEIRTNTFTNRYTQEQFVNRLVVE